jgi:hypothetical protein
MMGMTTPGLDGGEAKVSKLLRRMRKSPSEMLSLGPEAIDDQT